MMCTSGSKWTLVVGRRLFESRPRADTMATSGSRVTRCRLVTMECSLNRTSRADEQRYVHAYIHTYLRTYVHTYFPTCLHIYLLTYVSISTPLTRKGTHAKTRRLMDENSV